MGVYITFALAYLHRHAFLVQYLTCLVIACPPFCFCWMVDQPGRCHQQRDLLLVFFLRYTAQAATDYGVKKAAR